MGNTGSKPAATQEKAPSKGLKALNVLDLLATKYILTQNFQDMKRLASKEYCDKLVILTADVIKKYLNDKEITYLSERLQDGLPASELVKERLIYLDTGEQLTDRPARRERGVWWEPKQRPRGRSILKSIDVRDPKTKDSMCKGIAKFYVKVAHLFAAIVKTINPTYRWRDSRGALHQYSIMNKNKIPQGADVAVIQANLCSRRAGALKAVNTGDGKMTVAAANCDMNKRSAVLSRENAPNRPADWGTTVTTTRTLGEEVGIPSLERLYYDVYNYSTGSFDGMSEAAEKQYTRDLRTFYEVFTGKDNFAEWKARAESSGGKARFSDIPLVDYHNQEICKDADSPWRRSYSGDSNDSLFAKYAENIKQMIAATKENESKLLGVLDEVFVWVGPRDGENSVTINPDLTNEGLQAMISKTRSQIVQLYVACEKDYQTGLQLFEAIIGQRMLRTTILKKEQLERQVDAITAGHEPDPAVEALIKESMLATAKEAAEATAKEATAKEAAEAPAT